MQPTPPGYRELKRGEVIWRLDMMWALGDPQCGLVPSHDSTIGERYNPDDHAYGRFRRADFSNFPKENDT